MINFITDNILLILFLIWGFPLFYYRSKFRKIVYNTDSWTINFRPVFINELRFLFSNFKGYNRKQMKYRNFYRFYLLLYLILATVYIANANQQNQKDMEKLKVGSKIPSFSLKDQNGNVFSIDSVLGKKNLVIYFYPKDDSPGCTKEACSFRDQFSVFEDADAIVIGINSQSSESHRKFAEKYNLNFTLLSDSDNKVRKLFDVKNDLLGLLPGRVTFVINKEGRIVFKFNSQTQAEKHVTEALRILQDLK